MTEINDFIDALFAEARKQGLDEWQVKYVESESSDIQVFEQKVSKQGASAVRRLNLAVKAGDKIGHFVTECFDVAEAAFVVGEAAANAALMDCDEKFFFYDGHGEYRAVHPYRPQDDRLAAIDPAAYLREAERLAYAADKRIHQVIYTSFYKKKRKLLIRNSLGLNLEDETSAAGAYILLSAKDNGGIRSYGASVCFDKEADFDPACLARSAVDRVLAHLNPTDVVPQKMSVVFENRRFAEFLGAIAGIFDAYEVETGRSRLKGKIGEQIASPLLTIIDNPWLEGGFATVPFDGEGMPTKYKEVVKNGVLQTFLYGLCMADKHGCDSTGNGSGMQEAEIFNFYVQKGALPPETLLRELDNGVYIDKINGLRVGLNTVTGDFSAAAEGFEVKNGKIGRPLKQFTFAGNIYRLLKDIRAVGSDLTFYCSPFGSPSILADNITVVNS